jgi:hypothetical protein
MIMGHHCKRLGGDRMNKRGIYGEGNSRDGDGNLEALRGILAEKYSNNEELLDVIRRADEEQLYMLLQLLNLEVPLRGLLAERYADNEVLSDIIERADEQQLFALTKLLMAQTGSWGIAPNTIQDEVQYNHKPISATEADRCSKCGRHFWKDRQLKRCTYDGTKL